MQLCCYFTGFKEILDLRAAYKKQQGNSYQLKKFNELFLSENLIKIKDK